MKREKQTAKYNFKLQTFHPLNTQPVRELCKKIQPEANCMPASRQKRRRRKLHEQNEPPDIGKIAFYAAVGVYFVALFGLFQLID
ncbi:MAG: hypothetical protein AB7F96_19755 [Beijerinckiaceae bacterium]